MKINNMNSATVMIYLQRGNWRVRDHANKRSVCRGLPVWKASGASPSIEDLVGSAMLLAGGISGIAGWKAKALGWNREL